MSKPRPPVQPRAQHPTPRASSAPPLGARAHSNPAPIKLSPEEAKRIAAALMEMLKR